MQDFTHKLIENLNTPGQLEDDPDIIGIESDGTELILSLLDQALSAIDALTYSNVH